MEACAAEPVAAFRSAVDLPYLAGCMRQEIISQSVLQAEFERNVVVVPKKPRARVDSTLTLTRSAGIGSFRGGSCLGGGIFVGERHLGGTPDPAIGRASNGGSSL